MALTHWELINSIGRIDTSNGLEFITHSDNSNSAIPTTPINVRAYSTHSTHGTYVFTVTAPYRYGTQFVE